MNLIIDNDIIDKTGLSEFDLKIELAVALYKRGKLSLGQASEFAGIHKIEFQRQIGLRGETLNYDQSDLKEDLKNLEGFNS